MHIIKRKQYLLYIIILCLGISPKTEAQFNDLNKDLPCINKTFQLHVNVVLNDQGESLYPLELLESEIVAANKHFEPICAEFKICSIDTIYNYEYDSITAPQEFLEMSIIFRKTNKINLFLTSVVLNINTCGLAILNGISDPNNGIIYLACEGALSHELGHLFGLSHTFEGNGLENANGDNCETEGDLICDTPADPFTVGEDTALYVDEDCLFIYDGRDANNEYYQPEVGNIMSYYPCACGFSRQQYLIMAENYLNSLNKYW